MTLTGSQPGADQQPGATSETDCLTNEVELAFNQLGVPVRESSEVAVDAIFDSVSVAIVYRAKLAQSGVIFCSFGDAIQQYPDLVQQYLF